MRFVRCPAAARNTAGSAMFSHAAEWCSPTHASSNPSWSQRSIRSRSRRNVISGLSPSGWYGARNTPKLISAISRPPRSLRRPRDRLWHSGWPRRRSGTAQFATLLSSIITMGKLIYAAISSLDGYVADADGDFAWSMPDEEVHAFVNDLERSIGTYLYGRRLYEVMRVWDSDDAFPDPPPVIRDYA